MKLAKTLIIAAVAGAALTSFASGALADTSLLTSDAGYSGPELNLGPFADGSYNFTFGPTVVPGGITFVASPGGSGGYPYGGNSGEGSVIGQGDYGLAANGTFGGDAVYIGVDSGTGFDQLQLNAPVSEIGFFFNYAPGNGDDPTISALDADHNIIAGASFDLATLAPISTPGGFNEFAFRGISSTADNIYGLQIGGSYLLASGTATGAVVPPTSGVPEPSVWAMMLAGVAMIGAALRLTRKRSYSLAA
jgi:hypothetical protein